MTTNDTEAREDGWPHIPPTPNGDDLKLEWKEEARGVREDAEDKERARKYFSEYLEQDLPARGSLVVQAIAHALRRDREEREVQLVPCPKCGMPQGIKRHRDTLSAKLENLGKARILKGMKPVFRSPRCGILLEVSQLLPEETVDGSDDWYDTPDEAVDKALKEMDK